MTTQERAEAWAMKAVERMALEFPGTLFGLSNHAHVKAECIKIILTTLPIVEWMECAEALRIRSAPGCSCKSCQALANLDAKGKV